ncbi:MAG TPA: diaminopimelate epimerase [Acidiferrobacterales bacterium]|nr:diaminopimelate epimerase [Acidiferrobacterales bacterium]
MLRFTKMHGLGNDFVMIDAISQTVALSPEQVRRLADRRFGVGCDQVLIVERPTRSDVDFRYRIFNADGGEVEQCGNGARCFARFVRDQGLTAKDELAVETLAGVIHPKIEPDGTVTVNMGVPCFEPRAVPFEASARLPVYDLDVDGAAVPVTVLSMGNPHAVQVVANVERAPVTTQGPKIEHHPRFPKRVNAGYMQVLDRGHIHVRVWERGAGETLACGTGACAAVVTGRLRGLLDENVAVRVRGGTLQVSWRGEGEPVWMTGPAVRVFEGEIDLERLGDSD